ncbi:alpha-1,2 mannosyltransferase KTR1 [Coprinopsis cinerea AmutBmut pab1-1]|nr:alpha-1,2 mannosyltransferase KTR1 [Coprinopsis cinerea AmutBmut pab1-1]
MLRHTHHRERWSSSLKPTLTHLLKSRTLWRNIILFVSIIVPAITFIMTVPKYSHKRHKSMQLTIERAQESLRGVPSHHRANATFVMLCRNREIEGVISSVRQVEDRFNDNYGYPWVFLNDEPFTEEFKRRVSVLIKSPVHFGVIPPDVWNQPDWIDEEKAAAGRKKMVEEMIIYGDSVPYRNMCRFNSGFFYRHELMLPYRYYWRIEPDVDYFCDLSYDPFTYMEVNKKVYGFTISLLEWVETVPTLWDATKEFMKENPQYVHPDNAMEFISDNGGEDYNMCHFWSNFEIADMDFWRGEAYSAYFEWLEKKGGFYYERWGDAPVHSIGVSLFAPKESIHYFYDIGYRHDGFRHCPGGQVWEQGKCWCDKGRSFNNRKSSCTRKFKQMQKTYY